MNTSFETAARYLAANPAVQERIEAEILWDFVCYLPNGPDLRRMAEAMVVQGVIGADDLSEKLGLPQTHVEQLLQVLYRKLLEWRRGGLKSGPVRLDPPKNLFLCSVRELESALAFNLDEADLDTVDAEVESTLADEDTENSDSVSIDSEDGQVISIEGTASASRKRLWRPRLKGDSKVALAAATEARKKSDVEKIEGCEIGLGDVLYIFYTDRKHIYLSGLADDKDHRLIINGKEYPLRWDSQKHMHRATGLTYLSLDEVAEMIDQEDERAFFDIR